MWVLRQRVTHHPGTGRYRPALEEPGPGKFLRHTRVAETHVAWESQGLSPGPEHYSGSSNVTGWGGGMRRWMSCRTSWKASRGSKREAGVTSLDPLLSAYFAAREVVAPPSCPPSLGKRAPQAPSSDSLEPPWVVETLEPKFRRGSISRLSPTISASPCHPASRVQSRTAPHPHSRFHPNSKRPEQAPPSSPPSES